MPTCVWLIDKQSSAGIHRHCSVEELMCQFIDYRASLCCLDSLITVFRQPQANSENQPLERCSFVQSSSCNIRILRKWPANKECGCTFQWLPRRPIAQKILDQLGRHIPMLDVTECVATPCCTSSIGRVGLGACVTAASRIRAFWKSFLGRLWPHCHALDQVKSHARINWEQRVKCRQTEANWKWRWRKIRCGSAPPRTDDVQ